MYEIEIYQFLRKQKHFIRKYADMFELVICFQKICDTISTSLFVIIGRNKGATATELERKWV